MKWVYFGFAVFFEIIGTSLLKLSQGNEKWYFTILSILSYVVCFWIFGKAIKYFEVGTAYAMWSGIGIVATTVIGFIFFKDDITMMKIVCIMLILLGVIGLNFLGR